MQYIWKMSYIERSAELTLVVIDSKSDKIKRYTYHPIALSPTRQILKLFELSQNDWDPTSKHGKIWQLLKGFEYKVYRIESKLSDRMINKLEAVLILDHNVSNEGLYHSRD